MTNFQRVHSSLETKSVKSCLFMIQLTAGGSKTESYRHAAGTDKFSHCEIYSLVRRACIEEFTGPVFTQFLIAINEFISVHQYSNHAGERGQIRRGNAVADRTVGCVLFGFMWRSFETQ